MNKNPLIYLNNSPAATTLENINNIIQSEFVSRAEDAIDKKNEIYSWNQKNTYENELNGINESQMNEHHNDSDNNNNSKAEQQISKNVITKYNDDGTVSTYFDKRKIRIAPRSTLQFKVGPPFTPSEILNKVYLNDTEKCITLELMPRIDRGFDFIDKEWIGYKRNYFTLVSCFKFLEIDENQLFFNNFTFNLNDNNNRHQIKYFAIRLIARCYEDNSFMTLVQHTAKRDKGPQINPQIHPLIPSELPNHQTIREASNVRNKIKKKKYDSTFYLHRDQLAVKKLKGILSTYPDDEIKKVVRYERVQFASSIAIKKPSQSNMHFKLIVVLGGVVDGNVMSQLDKTGNECYDEENNTTFVPICVRETPSLIIRGRSPSNYASYRQENKNSTEKKPVRVKEQHVNKKEQKLKKNNSNIGGNYQVENLVKPLLEKKDKIIAKKVENIDINMNANNLTTNDAKYVKSDEINKKSKNKKSCSFDKNKKSLPTKITNFDLSDPLNYMDEHLIINMENNQYLDPELFYRVSKRNSRVITKDNNEKKSKISTDKKFNIIQNMMEKKLMELNCLGESNKDGIESDVDIADLQIYLGNTCKKDSTGDVSLNPNDVFQKEYILEVTRDSSNNFINGITCTNNIQRSFSYPLSINLVNPKYCVDENTQIFFDSVSKTETSKLKVKKKRGRKPKNCHEKVAENQASLLLTINSDFSSDDQKLAELLLKETQELIQYSTNNEKEDYFSIIAESPINYGSSASSLSPKLRKSDEDIYLDIECQYHFKESYYEHYQEHQNYGECSIPRSANLSVLSTVSASIASINLSRPGSSLLSNNKEVFFSKKKTLTMNDEVLNKKPSDLLFDESIGEISFFNTQ
ncbi:uncharacterized protein SCODWIG_02539 [Saccharomycodes ludwigii]|uniref:NDT80 domain-containing protein n=1 Tax=Saccharomycodes ludwigii TaxID=36035 RepID=A0A376B7X0_9ASCO|nr:uncharacterized protein SCODWIG_02539 [Saccharomycodes ludwigii]